jgi:hypothetical protein
MTRHTFLASLILALAASACTDAPTRGTYLQNFAVCVLHVDDEFAKPTATDVAIAKVEEIAIEAPPSSPPVDPYMTCCTNPDGCVDHAFTVATCAEAVAGVAGVVHTLSDGVRIAYDGTDPVNAFFGGCEQGDCEVQPTQRFTFDLAQTDAAYVVSVIDANTLMLYRVPAEALGGKVRAPDGAALHPVLAANHAYANHERPVVDSDGNLLGFIQNQSDCFDLGGVPVEGDDPSTECAVEEWYCLVC